MRQYRLWEPTLQSSQGPVPDLWGQVYLMSPTEFAARAAELPQGEKLENSLRPITYCKVENFLHSTQGAISVPIQQIAFGFYLRPEFLILVGAEDKLEPILEQVYPTVPSGCSPSHFLLLLLEQLISDGLPHFQQLGEHLSALEEALLRQETQQFYQVIIGYRKQLNAYHSYYEQIGDVGEQMQQSVCCKMGEEEARGWQLYSNRADRLHNRELYQSQIDLRQNRIMALLTVVTTIFLPLTLITGWYGMNFPNMFALRWKYGYLMVILLGVAIVALEILYFKRKKML